MRKPQMNYINCKDSYPLQLKGRMMVHSKPKQNQNMKNSMNYQKNSVSSSKSNKNQDLLPQNHSIRKALADKIGDNQNLLSKNYQKSVLPSQDTTSSRRRPQSVRTYKQQRHGSGINYLLQANQNALFKAKQKSHLKQYHVAPRQVHGRKMVSVSQYQIPNYKQEISKKQNHNSEQLMRRSQRNVYSNTAQVIKKIPETTLMRVQQDIYSSMNRFEPQKIAQISKTRFSNQNKFKIGLDLGYEKINQKKLNCQKITEMMGSTYCKKDQQQKAIKRDDWRRSSFVFQ